MRRCLDRLLAQLRGFARNRRGIAAVEFAIILPFMLVLYLGSIEAGNGLAVQFKASLASRAVADLASQYTSIDNTTMTGILNATGMVVTISEITTNASGQGTIAWSDSLGGTAHSVGQSVTLPTALQIANTSLIWSEVTYPYQPSLGMVMTGTINIYQRSYFYPRLATSITRVNS